ncbi:serine hydrolase domain-containing protein [Candidatus Villigracilis affinis]|uniref:serine hydrolase domain-containing protein n=1 Tax=Candidatus Villigracilis affinis TaxID=3140682 RepID=UPI001D212357|nr:beta-lactamase family protein [Anaerolineales bacterium]
MKIWSTRVFIGLLILIFSFSQLPVASASSVNASKVEEIDTFVNNQMKRHGIPGLALALVDGDKVIFMKGYGKADQTGRPITPQTPFILASVSKPLTAVAIMQLVDAGQVELDAPVQKYLPEFRVADLTASGQITVRHLLLHTSGIPATACDTKINAKTIEEYVAELQTVKLDAPVGTRHSYCSGNYNVLGRVIEVISGQSFGAYMQENIFTPLDMRQSFTSEQEAKQAGLAQGYQWLFGLSVPTQHPYNPSQLPSGYMISSAEDMSHFLISQLNDGQYADTNLLSANSVAAMQVAGTKRGENGGYGFGWVIAPVGDVPAVWHDGVNVNFHSLLLMQPETKRGAVVLMNSFGIVAYEGAYREIEEGVARMLADLEPAPTSTRLGTVYLMIDTLLAGLLAIVLFPLLRMRFWRRWLLVQQQENRLPLIRVSLRAAWEIGFALAFLIGIRVVIVTGLGAQSWVEVLTVFPDFVLWIWVFALTVLLTGVIRMKLILQTRQAIVGDDNPAAKASAI